MTNPNDFFTWRDKRETPIPTDTIKTNVAQDEIVTDDLPQALTPRQMRDLAVLEDMLREQAKDMALARRSYSGSLGYLSAQTARYTAVSRVVCETTCRKYANRLKDILEANEAR